MALVALFVVTAAAVGLAGQGCSRRESDVERRSGALTLSLNAEILGFENAASWTVSSGTKALSTTHTEGARALSIASPVNYTTIVSAPLTSSGPELAGIVPGASFRVDLRLPTTQPNPYWYGAMQMFVTSVSRQVYNQYLGQVELTGTPLGVFKTHQFAIPLFVVDLLRAGPYSDLAITIVLNVPSAGTGTYLLDNLRLRGDEGSAGNVHPTLACVVQRGPSLFDAVFGYFSDSSQRTRLPIGPQNKFTPGPEGRGQVERFFPGRVDAAFAVTFNGAEIVWQLPNGAVAASAASPRCPNATCPVPCARGQQCRGGLCVTECGDGMCAGEEACGSCPADCVCSAGAVCYQNNCAFPATCGGPVGWACGAGTSFGVAVDCGSCPAGKTCSNHRCL